MTLWEGTGKRNTLIPTTSTFTNFNFDNPAWHDEIKSAADNRSLAQRQNIKAEWVYYNVHVKLA